VRNISSLGTYIFRVGRRGVCIRMHRIDVVCWAAEAGSSSSRITSLGVAFLDGKRVGSPVSDRARVLNLESRRSTRYLVCMLFHVRFRVLHEK